MQTPRKILCIIDPTVETHPVLQRAAWLAEKTGATVELRVCFYNQLLSGGLLLDSRSLERAREEVIEAQQDVLDEIVKDLTGSGIKASASVVWDHPLADAIVRSAVETGADLVMKDTHQHSALDVSTLSNTDWNLIRNCPVPLWLVKPNTSMSSLKIVAAVDPTHEHDKPADLDNRIIQLGKTLASEIDAELHVCHVIDTQATLVRTSRHAIEPTFTLDPEVLERLREFHRKAFEQLTARHGITEDRTHLVEGNVHEALPNVAADIGAHLIVMGAVARSRLKHIFIGATAERTLDRIRGELLVVKPGGFETPVPSDDP